MAEGFELRREFNDGALHLNECLRQHLAYCLYTDFDQILDTNLITVKCCACHVDIKLSYDRITDMYCHNCKNVDFTQEAFECHAAELKARLTKIRQRLMTL
jgi:hypothetical protein